MAERKQYQTIFNHAFIDFFYHHMKPREIAIKYGVQYKTVLTWKTTQKWKDKLKRAQKETDTILQKHKAAEKIREQALEPSSNPDAGGIDKPRETDKRPASLIDVERVLDVQDEYSKLSEPWKVFVDEYIHNGANATQAYLMAFKCSYENAHNEGARAARSPRLAHIIAVKQAERAALAHVDAEYVLINAKQVVARCLQAAPVMVFDKKQKEYVQATNEDGRPIWQFDSKGANQALELIAKSMGMLTENKNINVSGTVGLAALSDDELMREYNKQMQASKEIDVTPSRPQIEDSKHEK